VEKIDITLAKAGGAFCTNKDDVDADPALKLDAIHDLIGVINEFRAKHPDDKLVLGHGGGSWAHRVAWEHMQRIQSKQWDEEAAIAVRASSQDLNRLLREMFIEAGLPIDVMKTEDLIHKGPDGYVLSTEGVSSIPALEQSFSANRIPLLYGAMIDTPGGYEVLSTEALLLELGRHWQGRVKQAMFFSDRLGVEAKLNGPILSGVQVAELEEIQRLAVRSRRPDVRDVSGEMGEKLKNARGMANLGIPVFIGRPSLAALEGEPTQGTWITA
jgi:isopentenyl phosphate kinase